MNYNKINNKIPDIILFNINNFGRVLIIFYFFQHEYIIKQKEKYINWIFPTNDFVRNTQNKQHPFV